MKRFLYLILGVALLALDTSPSQAAQQELCAPPAPSAAPGPRQVVNPVTATTYNLDPRGCGLIVQADIGYFLSQGYRPPGEKFKIIYTTGVMTGTTSVQMGTLPAGGIIESIVVDNTVAAAITGGLDIGKTTGAADVVSALTCGASCLVSVADAALLLRVFSKTAGQAIWLTGHTAWNSANVTVTLTYSYF